MNARTGIVTRIVSHLVSRRLIVAGIAALAVGLHAPRAEAQMGLGMMGGEMGDLVKPSTNARLLKQYAAILGLSPDQKRAADELLLAYQTEFRDAVTRLEEIFNSVREEADETGEWEVYQQVLPGVMVKFMKRTQTLNNTFMSDLKMLLDGPQLDRFAQVERLHRRKSAIKMGLDGLQRLDLIEVVDGLGVDPGAASGAAGVLDQYAVEIDREMVGRDKTMRDFVEEMARMIEDGKNFEEDPEMMAKWMKEMNDAGERLESINAGYIPRVRSALPETVHGEFDRQVKVAKYPAIYRRSHAARVFDAADKLQLDATQQEGIRTLKEAYVRDSEAANDKWASVLDDLKANQPDMGMFGSGMWMIRQDPKYTEARDARKAIDDKAVDAVSALLTEEQRAKLPKKNYRPEWDFDRASNE